MSENHPNVKLTSDQTINVPKSTPDKRKLTLSQSENTLDLQKSIIKHKLLGKVKSWSSKEHHAKEKVLSIELDLARSLSKLDVVDSNNDNISTNLLRARDSLDSFLKDEQNMPKPYLEKSILHPKSKSTPNSPKSSPQLGGNLRASTSKAPFWIQPGKKNRKDIKKNGKIKNMDPTRNEASANPAEGKQVSKSNAEAAEEASLMEEEGVNKFAYNYNFAKNSKSVVFTNEVLVVYFNNEDVVGEEKEPLKKELEQQTRNKEMRRVHLTKTQEKYNLCLF
ncbi:uncharacterized protein LOC126742425 [Anthonomus grandis grandis]|uniref:uncharacterized protein LOC126742425 n=1 Tax=Anthonomus grandis grandis TaxID=2921223 RepID=UPI002166BED2|nr:uncharacterized protein LOC126742425 [Anthonomus grandis grandis]